MKIVLDTNVLISALIFPGVSSEVFDFVVQNHEAIISDWILAEFAEKCRDKFKIPPAILAETLNHLREKLSFETPKGKKPQICRDSDDDNILWLAASTDSELIITGDQDLLVLKSYNKIHIISPREYKANYMNV